MTAPTAQDEHKLFGSAVLFIFRTQTWTPSTFAGAARFARSLGFDTIAPKRGEGTERWYGDVATLKLERTMVLSEGVGYAPFWYCDGPKFGNDFVAGECDVLKELGDANDGIAVADMETEWDGQYEAASLFEQQMRPWPGTLAVTTWADPNQQGWGHGPGNEVGVAARIAPCVNVWIPQRYDNWLAAQLPLPEQTIIQPGVDLSSEFGPNDVLAQIKRIAAQNGSAWMWEYIYAQENQAFTRTLCSILHHEALAELPGLTLDTESAPEPGYTRAYVTTGADHSLAQLAPQLGLSNWYQDLYKPNMEAIESAARAAGYAGSSGGTIIVPGIKLSYNP